MDAVFIERLVDIFSRSSLAELEFSQDGATIRLAKSVHADSGVATHSSTSNLVGDGDDDLTATAGSIASVKNAAHLIRAGIVGVFYRSPAPDKPPFVEIGDSVEDGQTLGILEAMKTLNPIEADRAGRIAKILREDGAAVEAGAPLFLIKAEE